VSVKKKKSERRQVLKGKAWSKDESIKRGGGGEKPAWLTGVSSRRKKKRETFFRKRFLADCSTREKGERNKKGKDPRATTGSGEKKRTLDVEGTLVRI